MTDADKELIALERRIGSPGLGEDELEDNEIATAETAEAKAEVVDAGDEVTEGEPEVADSNKSWTVP